MEPAESPRPAWDAGAGAKVVKLVGTTAAAQSVDQKEEDHQVGWSAGATHGALPGPPIAPDIDLMKRGATWFPIDARDLRDRAFGALEKPQVFLLDLLALAAAWTQRPTGSLPGDEAALAHLLGFGRSVKALRKARANGALVAWRLHHDGRLYAKPVTDLVLETKAKLDKSFNRTVRAREKRAENREREQQTTANPGGEDRL